MYEIEKCSTLREVLKYRMKKYPDSDVFVYWDEEHKNTISVSTERFIKQVEQLGTYLLSVGMNNKKIAIIGDNSYYWVLAFFAIVNSGNIAVLIDKGQNIDTAIKLMKESDCEALVYGDDYFDIAGKAEEFLSIQMIAMNMLPSAVNEGEKLILDGDTSFYDTEINEDTAAVIAFTSGTTGENKGVLLSHGNLALDLSYGARYFDYSGRNLLLLPLHHMYGLTVGCLASVIWGSTLYISESLRYITSDIVQARPTVIAAIPALLPMLFKILEPLVNDGIKPDIMSGGAPKEKKWMESFESIGIRVYNAYGITECSPGIAVETPLFDRMGLIIIQGWQVKTDTADGISSGEILVKGPNVMLGYYKDEEETAHAMRGGWFHTGDMGYINEAGSLVITGRIKNMIALPNGENIYPEKTEKKLMRISGVKECVVALSDGILMAEIYCADGANEAIKENVSKFNRELPSSQRIQKLVFRSNEFPKTSSGKIIR